MAGVKNIVADYQSMWDKTPVERMRILAKKHECRMIEIRECLHHMGIDLKQKKSIYG